jgi:hypothetical protein
MMRSFPARSLAVLALAVVATLQPAAPARAEKIKDSASFSVIVKGITAGTLSFSAVQDGAGYAVQGRLSTSGLAAFLRKVRYDAKARGRVQDGAYVPASYTERADTGSRQSEATMAYAAGVPQVKQYAPARKPRSYDLDPAQQGGSVDPLTAMYATLRDVDAGQECRVDLKMFDGRRASRLTLQKPRADGERVICAGEYRRLGGFSPEDMAERTRFGFTVTYAPAPVEGRMQVVEVAMDTLFGRARMVRE